MSSCCSFACEAADVELSWAEMRDARPNSLTCATERVKINNWPFNYDAQHQSSTAHFTGDAKLAAGVLCPHHIVGVNCNGNDLHENVTHERASECNRNSSAELVGGLCVEPRGLDSCMFWMLIMGLTHPRT